MREMPVTISTSCISLFVGILLYSSLIPFPSSIFRNASAAVTTAISPTGGTGSPASLGTIITSGTSTAPTPLCSTSCVITGGTRAGNNLFHSFGDFNMGAFDGARFQTGLVNPLPDASVSNILARITGGPSNIFGNLNSATYYPSANLFLVNPAGFLFGPNATVNVGGMMTFTTADYIRLTDSGRFNANLNTTQADLLTAAPIAAFGFTGSTHAIDFKGGQLGVAEGTGIALVGGDINLIPDSSGTMSSITAPGRQVQITSVAGPGEVAADTVMPDVGMTPGLITLGQGSILSTAGIDSSFRNGNGGAVSIRGGQFVMTGAKIKTSPAEGSSGSGGAIAVNVTGSARFTSSEITTAPAEFSLAGSAAPVVIKTNESLSITNTTIDTTSSFAGGNGGSVTLETTNGPLSLTDSRIRTVASAPGNGGAVAIEGEDVTLTNSSIATDVDAGSFDASSDPAIREVHPGAVTVTAQDTVTISGSAKGTLIISATAFGTSLDAGSVKITGKTVSLLDGKIDTALNDGGIASSASGGTVEIRGNNINSTRFEIFSNAANIFESRGTGGSILFRGTDNLRAESIQLANSSVNTASGGGGGGGPIRFQAKALTLTDHTDVATSSFGKGSGGSIMVTGAENVTIEFGSRILTDVVTGQAGTFPGTAGNILLETNHLAVFSGGQINARALQNSTGNAGNITVQGNSNNPPQSILIDGTGSGIFTDTQGTGAGGNIVVNANTVTIQNGGTLSATTSGTAHTATGGSITVTATDHVTMTSDASITANSTGPANAGNISIDAGQQFDMRDSSVTAKAKLASGGIIDIQATDRIRVVNSEISSSVQGGTSTAGGNITIDPNVVVLQNSEVTARAVQGAGGNITITTPLFLADSSSLVSASSQFGLNGTVTIQSPTSNLSESLGTLPSEPNQAHRLLTQRCAALVNNGQASSFVVAGREQLPSDPGGWLSSPLALVSLGESLDADNAVASIPTVMAIAAQDTGTVSLRRLTPAGFLMANFAESEATGCRS
jgi:filamentous hemagglutinin family protein